MKRQKPALRDDVSQEEKTKKDGKCNVIPDPIKKSHFGVRFAKLSILYN
jgi:hypothetical protein